MAKKNAKIKGFGKLRVRQIDWRSSRMRQLVQYPAMTAVALIVTLALARSTLPVNSAVTEGVTQKLTVYQGVAVIAPGEATDSVLELGNAGRDIASTGAIYFRPNSTNAGSYFDGSGSTQNLYLTGNLGVGVAGSSYPFVVGRDVDGQVYGARFQNMSTGAAAYLRPLSFLRRNTDNNTTMEWYWEVPVGNTPELQLWRANRPDGQPVGWSNPVSFKYDGTTYFNSGNVGIGNVSPLSALVVNKGLGTPNDGDANNTVSLIGNTPGSTIFAEQENTSGWAGYFSGRVNITGALTMGGIDKATLGIQVCPTEDNPAGVNSGCLGQYLYSGPSFTPTANNNAATGLRYYYWRESDKTVQYVVVYGQFSPPEATCSTGYTKTTRCLGPAPDCHSRYRPMSGGCDDPFGEMMYRSATKPYGNPAQEVCVKNTSEIVVVKWTKSAATGGVCVEDNNPKGTYIEGYQLRAPQSGIFYLPIYELR